MVFVVGMFCGVAGLLLLVLWMTRATTPPTPALPPSPPLAPSKVGVRHQRQADGSRVGWSIPEMLAYSDAACVNGETVDQIVGAVRSGYFALQFGQASAAGQPLGDPPGEHVED